MSTLYIPSHGRLSSDRGRARGGRPARRSPASGLERQPATGKHDATIPGIAVVKDEKAVRVTSELPLAVLGSAVVGGAFVGLGNTSNAGITPSGAELRRPRDHRGLTGGPHGARRHHAAVPRQG